MNPIMSDKASSRKSSHPKKSPLYAPGRVQSCNISCRKTTHIFLWHVVEIQERDVSRFRPIFEKENVLTVTHPTALRLQIYYCYNLIKMGHSLFEKSVIRFILVPVPYTVSLPYCPKSQMDLHFQPLVNNLSSLSNDVLSQDPQSYPEV